MNSKNLIILVKRLHIWVALPCAVAMVVVGCAGIIATLHKASLPNDQHSEIRIVPYAVEPGEDNNKLARQIHARLALPLTRPLPAWALTKDEAGYLLMTYNTPNADHRVTVLDDKGVVRIESTKVPFTSFVFRLHTHTLSMPGPGMDWRIALWSIYMEFSIFALIFLAVTGAYLWLANRLNHRMAQISAALGFASAVIIFTTLK